MSQAVVLDLTQLEASLTSLEEKGQALTQDSEVANMLTSVSAMRTKAKTLSSEVENKKRQIQVTIKVFKCSQPFCIDFQ